MSEAKFGSTYKKKGYAMQGQRSKLAAAKGKQDRQAITQIARAAARAELGRQIETKYCDTTASALTGVTYTGALIPFSPPAAGTGVNQRVGDKVTVKELQLKYEVVGYDTTNLLRVLIFKWNNDDSVYSPGVGSVFGAGDLATGYAPLSRYNWDNLKGKDFEILYDECHALSFNNTTAAPGSECHVKSVRLFGRRLGSVPVIQLNSGAVTGKGNYYVLVISDSAVAGHPKVAYTMRMLYTDA